MTLTCQDLLQHLSAYLDDELDAELMAAAEAHLDTCPNCRIVLSSTQHTLALYRQHYRPQLAPDTRHKLHAQLLEMLSDERPEKRKREEGRK